jgi:hypothetical protein
MTTFDNYDAFKKEYFRLSKLVATGAYLLNSEQVRVNSRQLAELIDNHPQEWESQAWIAYLWSPKRPMRKD